MSSVGSSPRASARSSSSPCRPGSSRRSTTDVEQLLQGVAADSGSKLDRKKDSFGFEWVIVRDPELEDEVTAVYAVGEGVHGARIRRPAARRGVPLRGRQHPVYWIYGFKTGTFWPFVPTGEKQERDNAQELELKAKLEPELPVEQDLTKWLALFDAPI